MSSRSTLVLAAFMATATSLSPRSAEGATFRRGPYLQDLGSRQVAVMMELDGPHAVSITVSRGAVGDQPVKTVPAAGSDVLHEIVVGGLEPATSYAYSVRIDDGTTQGGTFTTAPEDDRPLKFLLYGDNRSDDSSHAGIVAAMKNAPGEFILQTGDMVQDGSDEALWLRFFDLERDLLRDRCMFPAIGNHEVSLPTSDGALRFARMFRLPGPASSSERYYTFRWGFARFFMLDAQDDFASEEREWLESALAAAEHEEGLVWRFVALHNGPYSSGLHGPNRALHLARVPDLLRRYRIDVIFSGHDHIYERGEVTGSKYLVSGGGGAPLYREHRDEPTTLRFEAVHHFVSIELGKTSGAMVAIRKDGSTIERCTFAPGGTPGWGCPSEGAAAANAGPSADSAPVSPSPPRRACDCSFALSGAEWVGAALATILLLSAGLRRKHRPDEHAGWRGEDG